MVEVVVVVVAAAVVVAKGLFIVVPNGLLLLLLLLFIVDKNGFVVVVVVVGVDSDGAANGLFDMDDNGAANGLLLIVLNGLLLSLLLFGVSFVVVVANVENGLLNGEAAILNGLLGDNDGCCNDDGLIDTTEGELLSGDKFFALAV